MSSVIGFSSKSGMWEVWVNAQIRMYVGDSYTDAVGVFNAFARDAGTRYSRVQLLDRRFGKCEVVATAA